MRVAASADMQRRLSPHERLEIVSRSSLPSPIFSSLSSVPFLFPVSFSQAQLSSVGSKIRIGSSHREEADIISALNYNCSMKG